MESRTEEMGLSVPFRLDDGLGPNTADVMLVMCQFSVDLSGRFTVTISETSFRVTDVDISGGPFELRFAEDFPVLVTDLHVELDRAVDVPPGTLADPTGSGRFQVESEVPVQMRMQVHVQGVSEWIMVRTPFTLSGTIERSRINLSGHFAFHLQGYGEEDMPTKFGTCNVILNASSLLRFQLVRGEKANAMRLAFAGREAELSVGGSFAISLDGLDIRVLDLALTASPLHFPGLLRTDGIRVSLDPVTGPVAVVFHLEPGPRYRARAAVPARMRTRLTFEGFAPQLFEAPLLLCLEGGAALEAKLHLTLSERVEVAIGDGIVMLAVAARLEAKPFPLTEPPAGMADGRRALYAALREAPGGPFGSAVAPLRDALGSPDYTARLLAVKAMERRGGASVAPLIASALQDPADEVRVAAARALGGLNSDAQATMLLTSFERDPDDKVRLAALQALAALDTPTWLDATHIAIRDKNEVLRCQAALIMGDRGGVGVVGPLLEAMDDPNPFVKLCAGIGLLSAGREEAVDTIIRLSEDDEDMCVRMIGSIALGQTTHEEARRALQRIMETNEDVFVRRAVLYALAKQENLDAAPGSGARRPAPAG